MPLPRFFIPRKATHWPNASCKWNLENGKEQGESGGAREKKIEEKEEEEETKERVFFVRASSFPVNVNIYVSRGETHAPFPRKRWLRGTMPEFNLLYGFDESISLMRKLRGAGRILLG